jgi:hypothetical protein
LRKPAVIGILLAVGIVATIIITTFGNQGFRCEVCMTYKGRSACRIGAASTSEHAERTATQYACAQISDGSFDSARCENGRPDSVKWLKGR